MINMPALSVRQPWAWAIIHCGKDIENRTWWTNRTGRILIHAGKVLDGKPDDVLETCAAWAREAGIAAPQSILDLHTGGIVGAVDIVGCVNDSPSKWFIGPYGLQLRNPTPLPFHPCKGKLSFFTVGVPYEVPA